MATYVLNSWSLAEDYWHAPEVRVKRLVGFRDGETRQVITSPIDKIDGRTITTVSGSVYVLGDPDPLYLDWMAEHGFTYDESAPIRDRRGEAPIQSHSQGG